MKSQLWQSLSVFVRHSYQSLYSMNPFLDNDFPGWPFLEMQHLFPGLSDLCILPTLVICNLNKSSNTNATLQTGIWCVVKI